MDQLLIQLLPYLDATGTIAILIMLKVAWGIYNRVVAIEKEIIKSETRIENVRERLATLEDRMDEFANRTY
jgi:hypothetical protein